MEEYKQWRKKEQLQKTEEQNEMNHRQGPEGISWEHMRLDQGILKSRTSWFNVHDKGTRLHMGLKTLAMKTLKGLE